MAEARKMKMRARMQEGFPELQVLITHPMETGLRADKETKQKIPPHFIQKVVVEHNGKVVVTMNVGTGMSEDPLMSFRLKNAKNGDKVKVSWSDNKGESGSLEGVVEL